jgi:hypothetical protein
MDEWINKMWCTHTTGYYSALKRKEILSQITAWMSLESKILSEITQSQKDKYCIVLLLYKVK